MNSPLSTFYIENLGCAKNQVDAEVMVSALKNDGWELRENSDQADLIIVNTCSFIQPAREESVSTFMDFRHMYPGKRIIVAGCFSQRYGEDLESMLPEADGIFGNADPSRIAEYAAGVRSGTNRKVFIPEIGSEPLTERSPNYSMKGSAYVKIAEGCDNRCSYCAIPLIRGPLRSREIDSVVHEVEGLLTKGGFEIYLIAQDLGSFGADRGDVEIIPLLERLSSLTGRFWVRLLYIHPDKFPDRLLQLCAREERILPYFDLPFQHASEKVLRKMGRRGNGETYLKLVERIRSQLPQSCIRSTFLVGHPGEGKGEFDELLDFQSRARLDWAGFFTYSPEEGTASKQMRPGAFDGLAERTALKRKNKLEQRQVEITELRLDARIGKVLDILIEERIEGEPLCIGRSYFTAPEVDGAVVVHSETAQPGDIVRCKMIGRNGVDMEAFPYAG